MREICSKLTITAPGGRQWRITGTFIDDPEQISDIVQVFLLLNLRK